MLNLGLSLCVFSSNPRSEIHDSDGQESFWGGSSHDSFNSVFVVGPNSFCHGFGDRRTPCRLCCRADCTTTFGVARFDPGSLGQKSRACGGAQALGGCDESNRPGSVAGRPHRVSPVVEFPADLQCHEDGQQHLRPLAESPVPRQTSAEGRDSTPGGRDDRTGATRQGAGIGGPFQTGLLRSVSRTQDEPDSSCTDRIAQAVRRDCEREVPDWKGNAG